MNRNINGKEYHFPQLASIVEKCINGQKQGEVILILGKPGSGKSVFLAQLYEAIKDTIESLTAIRAEKLDSGVTAQKVFEVFNTTRYSDKPKVLIIDSLDVLAYTRREELQAWLNCIDKLKTMQGITIICASREFEANNLYPLNEQSWSEKISISQLSSDFIEDVLSDFHVDFMVLSQKFQVFLTTPLHLFHAVEILKNNNNLSNISSLNDLFSKLATRMGLTSHEYEMLSGFANDMIKKRTVELSFQLYRPELIDQLKKLNTEKPAITAFLEINEKNEKLSFTHQTLIDFFAAFDIVNNQQTIYKFVIVNNQSLFIRPTLYHILKFLRKDSENTLIRQLNEIFLDQTNKIRIHVKTAIISNIASWEQPSERETDYILQLLSNDIHNRDIILISFFNNNQNPDWYYALKDKYILPTLQNKNDNDLGFRLILQFLKNIAHSLKTEIFEITDLLLQKNDEFNDIFFYRLSKILSGIEDDPDFNKKYLDFINRFVQKASKNGFNGYVLTEICVRLAKYFPEEGLSLFILCLKNELNRKNKREIVENYQKFLPGVYKKTPYHVLNPFTDFFEQYISEDYENFKIYDYPFTLLFAQNHAYFGLENLYVWYKNNVLDFTKNISEESQLLINKLADSKWNTQKQLSILCKLNNPQIYINDLFTFLRDIFKHGKRNIYHELYLQILNNIFSFFGEAQQNEITYIIFDIKCDDQSDIEYWMWAGLNMIPKKFHTDIIKSKIKELKDKYSFAEYKYIPQIRETSCQAVTSKYSKKYIETLEQDALYTFLIENKDLTESWDFDNDEVYGGIEHLASEVAKVFADTPSKYKKIIEKITLEANINIYTRSFFYSVDINKFDSNDINWLIDLINSVNQREELNHSMARCIEKIADKLNSDQLENLKNTITLLCNSTDPQRDKFLESRRKGYDNDAITEGINSTRGIMAFNLIRLIYKFNDKEWLKILLVKLSNDPTINVRASIVRYLPFALKPLGWKDCFSIFKNAFEKGPEEYSEAIIYFLKDVPKENFHDLDPIFEKFNQKIQTNLGKTYCSLMALFYLQKLINLDQFLYIFNNPKLDEKNKSESIRIIANHMDQTEFIDLGISIFANILETMNNVPANFSIIFRIVNPEDLVKVEPIINKILSKSQIDAHIIHFMLEYLGKCLLIDAVKTFEILEKLLSVLEKDCSRIDFYITHSESPLRIINTIFECYPQYEDRALKVFDKLIALGWRGTEEYLKEIDRL